MNRILKCLAKSPIGIERINEVLRDTASLYRVYYIPKKDNTGNRMISAPSDELKDLQYLVLPKIKRLPIHKASAAYEKGCSTKKNAKRHSKRDYILHIDIKSFFPSIDQNVFNTTLKRFYNSEELDTLWSLCSYKGGLPIGAPTSPYLCNRIMRKIDKKLNRLSFSLRYTRYADDMIFSSKKYIDRTIINKVSDILAIYGFRINDSKTYFMSYRREVTGIILTDQDKLSTGTSYKKELKKDIYNLLVRNVGRKDVVIGKLAYLRNIEPQYAEVLKRKYINNDNINLFKGI